MYKSINPPENAEWGICLKRFGKYWIAFSTDKLFLTIGDMPPHKVTGRFPKSPEIITAMLKKKEGQGYKVVAEWKSDTQWVPREAATPTNNTTLPTSRGGGGKYGKHHQLPTPPPNRPVPPIPPPKPMTIIDLVRKWRDEAPDDECF